MKKWKTFFIWAAVAAVAGTGTANYVLAADTSNPVVENEMLVTAKSNQAEHDIPVFSTIITSEDIVLSNASSIKDVLFEQAGINLGVNSSSEHGRQNCRSAFTVRQCGTQRPGPGKGRG